MPHMKNLSDDEAQHILDILNDHIRWIEKQLHGSTGELRTKLLREFSDSHTLVKRFLESINK